MLIARLDVFDSVFLKGASSVRVVRQLYLVNFIIRLDGGTVGIVRQRLLSGGVRVLRVA